MYKLTNNTKVIYTEDGITLTDNFIAVKVRHLQRIESARPSDLNLESLFAAIGLTPEASETIFESLLNAGLLQLENPGQTIDGTYLAKRLKAFYVRESQRTWKANTALMALRSTVPQESLAKGFLLETYHHVKGAKWTSVPVLGHSLSKDQRNLFEKFYIGERSHFSIFERALTHLGIELEEIQSSIANTETELLERYFHSLASSCPLEFAAALIAPEVDGLSDLSNNKIDILDQLVAHHGIPNECAKAFRIHDHDHENDDHDSLPLQIIASYGQIPSQKAERLFEVLLHTIHAYDVMFNGIYRRYSQSFVVRAARYKEWM